MAILSDAEEKNCQFDDEVKALTVMHRIEPAELRVMVEAACVCWDQFLRKAGLIFRQLRLASALMIERGARRRHSLTRRLQQVSMELEGVE